MVPQDISTTESETAHRFFAGTASTYDVTVHLWTLGLDRWWKRRLVDRIPPHPNRILDQACGTGILTFRLAQMFPHCEIFGVDLHQEYLFQAMRKAKALKVHNIQFVQGFAEEVFFKEKWDCITSSYLAKYACTEKLVERASQMLRPGGMFIAHDFTYPRNAFVAHILGGYFRLMQVFGSPFFPEWETAFFELKGFLRQSHWVESLVDSLHRAGFTAVGVQHFTLGISTIVHAAHTRLT